GRQWGVGRKGNPGDPARNTGVILLVVPKETSADGNGHVRTEVGFGAEGFLTDATTGEFRDLAIPYFMNRDYGSGILLMVDRIAAHYAKEFNFQVNPSVQPQLRVQRPPPRQTSRGIPPIVWFVLLFVLLPLLTGGRRGCGCLPIFMATGMRGGWGGGRGGGWGGGGGGFGGGGGGGRMGGVWGGGGLWGGGSSRWWGRWARKALPHTPLQISAWWHR